MTWIALIKVLAKLLFSVISWPSFTLFIPLYVSIWAIESDCYSKNQQCLTYWVLFSLITMLEMSFPMFFEWLSFWPYVKGVAIVLLVIPQFGGAFYIYKHFLRPYVVENSQIRNILFIPRKEDLVSSGQNNFSEAADGNSIQNVADESEKLVVCQGNSEPIYDTTESDNTCSTSPTKVQKEWSWSTSPKKVQKEWSCTLCQVSTSSERCLKKHLQGKKHKDKEEELRADDLAMKAPDKSSVMLKRTGVMLKKNLEQMILLENLKLKNWRDLLGPVTRSIIWCRWVKPDFGWTKLNTDGSIDRENSGVGGLLRDYKGDPICAFVSKASSNDIFLVELWAIWRGLVLAAGLGIKVIWVESDSMSAVNTINRKQSYSGKADSCLKSIWKLLKKFEKYKVSHSWRETNRAADHLAKMVPVGSDVVLWPVNFPDRLCNIIKEDAQGKIYRRG